MASYHSISVDDEETAQDLRASNSRRRNDHRIYFIVIAFAILALVTTSLRAFNRNNNDDQSKGAATDSSTLVETTSSTTGHHARRHMNTPIPTGVNLGSWLSLEDWFYVGNNGAVEVASPDDATAASCLPPLHLDSSTGPRWNSETDLLAGLAKHYKEIMDIKEDAEKQSTLGGYPNNKKQSLGPWGKAIQTIHAFRSSYIDFEKELETMASLGIKHVRVPVSWCWTDNDIDPNMKLVTKNETDPDNNDDNNWIYMDDEEVLKKYTCQDPFYDDVRWPAIPRGLVQRFLRACADHGIGATLDIHTYPGGTSIGTFSGVWPRYARFWTHGDVPALDDGQKPDVGRRLLKDFIAYLENLAVKDPHAFKGFRALSPMNEPAHLAGLYNGKKPIRTDRETFLPPLPSDIAEKYLQELNSGLESKPQLTKVPDGNHLRVLLWLRDAIDAFRQSSLPSMGKELHVNVHESLFPSDVLPKQEPKSDYGLNQAPMKVFGAWWRASTTADERAKWAVLDIHHYYAWGPQCSGTVEGPPTGRFACSDAEQRELIIGRCGTWASVYRSTLENECEKGLRLASAEFSASTHHSVRHACNDVTSLKLMLETQVDVAANADVELFWWSYKMPYGGAFRSAWSLKHLLYLLGVLPQPDEEIFHCGDHVKPLGEPEDGSI